MIVVSSITYAIRSRDILRRSGYRVSLEKLPANGGYSGCGQGVCVIGDVGEAAEILRNNGIKITSISYPD